MPGRSSDSAVLRWPDRDSVLSAAKKWARQLLAERPLVVRVGIIGSCARGDWGVGSDLDLVIEVSRSDTPFVRRAADFDASHLPVPTDIIVYTTEEVRKARATGTRFIADAEKEGVWIRRQE